MFNEATPAKVRDFVYLDIDRVKSVISQIDEGLIVSQEESSGTSKGVDGGGKISLPLAGELGASGTYLRENHVSITRTFHDHVFNLTEQQLTDLHRVMCLPQDFTSTEIKRESVRSSISPVGYILAQGIPQILDYEAMSTFMSNFNSIVTTLHKLTHSVELAKLESTQRSKRNNDLNKELQAKKIDANQVNGLTTILDLFYGNRVVIKFLPYQDESIRVVAPLRPEFLRDTTDDLQFKYGPQPAQKWTVFGQISSIPIADQSGHSSEQYFGKEVSNALDHLFKVRREVDKHFMVTHPDIVITPIAIYRE